MDGNAGGLQFPDGQYSPRHRMLRIQIRPLVPRWKSGPADQDETPHSVRCHRPGDVKADLTKTACNQVGRVRPPYKLAWRKMLRAPGGSQTENETLTSSQRDLILVVRGAQLRHERGSAIKPPCARIEIDQAAPVLRVLLGNHPRRAPERGLGDRHAFQRLREHRLGPSGHEPQTGTYLSCREHALNDTDGRVRRVELTRQHRDEGRQLAHDCGSEVLRAHRNCLDSDRRRRGGDRRSDASSSDTISHRLRSGA